MNKARIYALAVLCIAAPARAQTLIDFEDLPPGTSVQTQYAARGVLFTGNYLDVDPAAHSGTHVLRKFAPNVEFFEVEPMVMTFTSPQARVKLFAGSQSVSANATLKAFDAANHVVASAGPLLVPQNTFTTALEVTASDAVITRVELQVEGTSFASIDDLEFQGSAPATLPTQPPVVTLSQPVDGINVDIPNDIPKLDIAGTVTGEGLLSQVTVTLAYKRPPQSASAPPLTLELPLTGSGTTRQFSLPGGISGMPIGPIVVTATAENIAALKGTAVSHLTNLPLPIRNRFGSDGGAATYGEFQYGLLKDCTIAVYEHGAISGKNGGAIAIRGDVLNKWLSLTGPFNEAGWFGCPSNEEGDTLGARSQPFERGRIYAHLPGATGPFYVPAVFTDAIDKRGGDPGIGLPLADPSDSPGPLRTWLFQRFARPDDPSWIIPSTLEIRGTPATLWMERQAGPWLTGQAILSGTFVRNAFDESTNKSPATLWEGFACNDNLGPCTVNAEPDFPPPIAPENQPNIGVQFCDGTTYFPGKPAGPPEWRSIRGQYDVTPVFGAVISSHMADIDNGFTHRTHNGNCPYLDAGLAIGVVVLSLVIPPAIAVPAVLGTYVAAEDYGVTCASDYEFFVRPLGPMIDTRPQLPSLFGKSNTDRIKTEYEVAYAAAAHQFLGTPSVGDLVHTTGRWIVDCGHDSYKTELHPIFSYARMKTVVTETNAFTGLEDPLFSGKPATRIGIWVNGWFPGGDNNAVEFDIFPPPRPSPTKVLHIVKPVDNAAGGFRAAQDVDMNASFGPAGAATKVHLRFTAPRRENAVSGAGEMLFQSGRQYWGIWYLYWGD